MIITQLLTHLSSLDLNKTLPQVGVCSTPGGCESAGQTLIATVLKIVFGITGAIAMIIITVAGIQYIISQGDPQKTAKAKNTIIYAVIGLAIAVLGVSIVTFVTGKLT